MRLDCAKVCVWEHPIPVTMLRWFDFSWVGKRVHEARQVVSVPLFREGKQASGYPAPQIRQVFLGIGVCPSKYELTGSRDRLWGGALTHGY